MSERIQGTMNAHTLSASRLVLRVRRGLGQLKQLVKQTTTEREERAGIVY